MRRIVIALMFLHSLFSFALTETDGANYIKNYYNLLNQYATAESPSLARRIGAMHIGKGHVYPDVEIKLGGLSEADYVGIETAYLVSIDSRRNMLLRFIPKNISLSGNANGVCTMTYTLYVYSGNEQPGKDVYKYNVPLKMEIQNSDRKIRGIYNNTAKTVSPTPTAKINKITVEQNQNLSDGKGMVIHVNFEVQNMKGKDGHVSAYFYDNEGKALIDKNKKYYTNESPAYVATFMAIKPGYDNTTYSDLQLSIPYSEFHLSGTNAKTLQFNIIIWDRSVTPHKSITKSTFTKFTYTPESGDDEKVSSAGYKDVVISRSDGKSSRLCGTAITYTDNAQHNSYSDETKKYNFSNGAIAEKSWVLLSNEGKQTGYMNNNIPQGLSKRLNEAYEQKQKIKDIAISNNNEHWAIVLENGEYYVSIVAYLAATEIFSKIEERNENILSIAVNDEGVYAVLTNKYIKESVYEYYDYFVYGRTEDLERKVVHLFEKIGGNVLYSVSASNKGIVVCTDYGVAFENISTRVYDQMRRAAAKFKIKYVKFTDRGTCLITDGESKYAYFM